MTAHEDTTIRVVIVDDHKVVCDGLRRSLARCDDIEIVEEAHTLAEALAVVRVAGPDVVLLDYRLPDGDAPELLDAMRRDRLVASVVVLTGHDEKYYLRKSLEAGAAGVLTKASADGDAIASAIRNCRRGVASMSREALETLRSPTAAAGDSPVAHLTEREVEVLALVSQGKTNSEIAHDLFVTVRTVKYHMTNILAKTGTRSRAEAVAVALRSGIVGPPAA